MFVRAGTILPRQPLVQSTADTPQGPLRLDIYPGPDCAGELYDDDGHSMAFASGGFFRQRVRCAVTADGLTIDFAPAEGSFRPWWHSIAVTVHDWSGAAIVQRDRTAVASRTASAEGVARFEVDGTNGGMHLSVAHR